jgi:3-hydroxyisobutyrate dehydrogenase-like beta-hydroxyacid dehydrogenase
MATNLIRSGASLMIYDRNPAAIARLGQLGAQIAESPKSMAETPGNFD